MSLTKMQEIGTNGIVSTDNISSLMSEQNQDMAANGFGEQVENVSKNFSASQDDDYMNFSFKKAAKKAAKGFGKGIRAVSTGGVSLIVDKKVKAKKAEADKKKKESALAKSKLNDLKKTTQASSAKANQAKRVAQQPNATPAQKQAAAAAAKKASADKALADRAARDAAAKDAAAKQAEQEHASLQENAPSEEELQNQSGNEEEQSSTEQMMEQMREQEDQSSEYPDEMQMQEEEGADGEDEYSADAFGDQLEAVGNGFDSTQDQDYFNAKGKLKKFVKKVAKKAGSDLKKVGQKLKTLNLAPIRGAYLGILKINLLGAASQLQEHKVAADKGSKPDIDKWKKVTDMWYKMGGNRTQFAKTVESGSKKKALLKKKGADGQDEWGYMDGPYADGSEGEWKNVAGEGAALLTAAAAVITSVKKILGKSPSGMDPESQKAVDTEASKTDTEFQEAVQAGPNASIPEDKRQDETGMSMKTWALIGGGVAAAGLVLWLLLRKRK
jgi:LPXTG-motif cell wall-anchored protein